MLSFAFLMEICCDMLEMVEEMAENRRFVHSVRSICSGERAGTWASVYDNCELSVLIEITLRWSIATSGKNLCRRYGFRKRWKVCWNKV